MLSSELGYQYVFEIPVFKIIKHLLLLEISFIKASFLVAYFSILAF